jgi:hypothetical protein
MSDGSSPNMLLSQHLTTPYIFLAYFHFCSLMHIFWMLRVHMRFSAFHEQSYMYIGLMVKLISKDRTNAHLKR